MSGKGAVLLGDQCPCGSGDLLVRCCGPLLQGSSFASSPEALMRSRYTAHVTADADHLWRTWHPRTRPSQVRLDPGATWLGLTVHWARDELVQFTARYRDGDTVRSVHETSRFERRAGRWLYLMDDDQAAGPVA